MGGVGIRSQFKRLDEQATFFGQLQNGDYFVKYETKRQLSTMVPWSELLYKVSPTEAWDYSGCALAFVTEAPVIKVLRMPG